VAVTLVGMTNYRILSYQSAYWKFKNNLSFRTYSLRPWQVSVDHGGDKKQWSAFSAIAELLYIFV